MSAGTPGLFKGENCHEVAQGACPPGQTETQSRRAGQDAVYRQMFLLEEGRPGAEMGLAIALLHAWLTAESNSESGLERVWLKNISPICIQMIETALQATDTVSLCAQ